MDLGLDGHVAIVTGASRGLGRSIAEAFVAEGMHVLATARSADELQSLASHSPSGAVVPVVCDMTDRDAVESLSVRAIKSFGRLDVIVNNAGIAQAARFEDEPLDRWDEALAVNLLAPVALAKAAGTVFLEQGHGKVINIASTSGAARQANPGGLFGIQGSAAPVHRGAGQRMGISQRAGERNCPGCVRNRRPESRPRVARDPGQAPPEDPCRSDGRSERNRSARLLPLITDLGFRHRLGICNRGGESSRL